MITIAKTIIKIFNNKFNTMNYYDEMVDYSDDEELDEVSDDIFYDKD